MWEGVAEFCAVAERQSFTAAAKKLGISVAQVSRQITQLEQRLNSKLFYRTTRKVALSDEGKIYYQHCAPLMRGLLEAEQALTSLHNEPSGQLKLTAPVTYGEAYVMPLVLSFMARYPRLEVEVELSNKPLDLITEGFDLAIRIGDLADSSMMATRLNTRVQYVCASPDYFKLHGRPLALAELSKHNCLSGNHEFWRFSASGKEQRIKIKGTLRCNSGVVLRQAALNGIGLIQLPDYYVADDLQQGRLVSVLNEFQIPEEAIWALYPHNRQLSPKVKLLIEFLAQGLTALV